MLSLSYVSQRVHRCRYVRRLDRLTYEMSNERPAISTYLAGIVYRGRHEAPPGECQSGDVRLKSCSGQKLHFSDAQLQTFDKIDFGCLKSYLPLNFDIDCLCCMFFLFFRFCACCVAAFWIKIYRYIKFSIWQICSSKLYIFEEKIVDKKKILKFTGGELFLYKF